MGRHGRPPKAYAFHSRKARFKVYCTSTGQQEALLQHILQIEGKESLRCAIVSPALSVSGEHSASVSARRARKSPLAPVLHYLADFRRSRRTTKTITSGSSGESSDGSDKSSAASSSSSSSSDDGSDDSSSDEDEDERAEGDNEEKHKEGNKEEQHQEDDSKALPYHVFLEYRTAPARSSENWGVAIFEGFDNTQHLVATTPQCTSKYKEEKDDYIADLLIEAYTATLDQSRSAPAVYGTPTLDEHSTLRLVCGKYSARTDQDKVIADIKLYCCGRGAAESTYDRIKKQWRRAYEIPITPRQRAVCVSGAVNEPPCHSHPFLPHKRLDEWVSRFVGAGKSLNRLTYKPMVLLGKPGRLGKTEWARSRGRHIYIRGALDPEKIHAGILQGADLLVLDNVKWNVLFNSDLGRALAEGQNSVTWNRRNGDRVDSKLAVPVIIVNNKKCKTWGPNGKTYWKENLEWVRVRKCLFDQSKTINMDAPLAILPPPSDSLSFLCQLLPPPSPPPPPPCSSSSSSPLPSLPPRSSPLSFDSSLPQSSSASSSLLPPLQVNRSKIDNYGPDSYLIADGLSKEDADRQLAAWEKCASDFKLMKYRGNPLARYKAFYCDPLAGSRTMYEYTGSEVESWEQREWPPEGLQLRDAVRARRAGEQPSGQRLLDKETQDQLAL